jgi:GWxTD domain-containing protein
MRKAVVASSLLLAAFLVVVPAAAQSIPELFQQVKQEVTAGSWAAGMHTLGTLESEAAKASEQMQRDLAGPIRFYRGVCEANLGRDDEAVADFSVFLKTQPDAIIDATMYSKKAVVAFAKARAQSADPAASLAMAYAKFRVPTDAADRDPVDEHWAEGPVQWIMTSEEKQAWSEITDPNARTAFVEQFWDSRSTLPGEDGRTFRQEFERRVAFADARLDQDGEPRGSLTDRGMVFLLLGAPSYANRRPLRTGDDKNDPSGMYAVASREAAVTGKTKASSKSAPFTSGRIQSMQYVSDGPANDAPETSSELEIWVYRGSRLPAGVPYQQVDVHYVTKKGYGKHVMQREPEATNTLRAAARQASPRPAAGPTRSASR